MPRLLKLDRMEIIGFKSFYGRTRFEFPEGITAVVGPNGCGKSNIGDAISWVLGEQKASSLRSDRMEDVIFNGSDAKRPLGMAEVSLHFKNVGAVAEAAAPVGSNGNGHAAGLLEAMERTTGPAPGPEVADDLPVPIVVASEFERHAPSGEDASAPGPDPDETSRTVPRFVVDEIPENVVVTRRLYRSGESEYVLNGERCRLKDIQDLLARTQIGTRLYTTIEQGKIDQILTSKPKDRRSIIEEAAGILGYKTKRRQAEQRLEATQANLLRLSDITSEVDKQIQSLKRQAAKARRYRRLQESLREKRASIAARRLKVLDAERGETLGRIAALQDRQAAAAAEMARTDAERESLRLRLEEGEEASRLRREEIHALDMEIDRLQARGASTRGQARDLEQRIAGARREGEELQARLEEHRRRAVELGESLAAEAERLAGAEGEFARVEAERAERASAIEAREAALVEARGGLLRHLDLLTATAKTRAATQEQIRSIEESQARVAVETAESRAALERLRSEATEIEARAAASRAERQALDDERARRDVEEKRARQDLFDIERRCEEIKGRTAALQERLAKLEDAERRHAGYDEGVGEIMNGAAGFTPSGVVGHSITVPRGLERAVAATLEGLLEGVIVPDRDQARRGVAHLRRRGNGRVSFVPERARRDRRLEAPAPPPDLLNRPGVLGTLVDRVGNLAADSPISRVLGRTLLVADLATASELAIAFPAWSYVTSDGDIVRDDGVVVGGEGGTVAHGMLARRAERDASVDQVSGLATERAALEDSLSTGRAALESLVAAHQISLAAVQDADRMILEMDLRLMQKRGEMHRLDASLPLLCAELERLAAMARERRAEADALEAQAAAAEGRRTGLEDSIRESSLDLASRRAELEAVQRRAGDTRAAVAAGHERRSSLERERQAVDTAMSESQARSARGEAEQGEWAARVIALGGEAESLKDAAASALERRADAAARDEAATAGLAYDRSLLHAREQASKEGRATHDALLRDLQEREVHLARLDSDLRHLEAACRDDLATTLDALRAVPDPDGGSARPLAEDEAEIETIKADLEAIGPVNLMAIEQYTELEERFGFLMAQKTDVESSIQSLRETIRKINRESRQRFLAAFEAIQAGFAQSFSTLFGGGRAELRLQEGEDDVLEAGIEIAAQPPGKRLQSIALLSGGEKALTAVALLFALFRYRPSPFCVLDEVDAPLDEANVERFTRLLRGFREETQFIVITHNRKSMEAADLLYGVTMEEPGVSKVLPLRFE